MSNVSNTAPTALALGGMGSLGVAYAMRSRAESAESSADLLHETVVRRTEMFERATAGEKYIPMPDGNELRRIASEITDGTSDIRGIVKPEPALTPAAVHMRAVADKPVLEGHALLQTAATNLERQAHGASRGMWIGVGVGVVATGAALLTKMLNPN